MAIVLKKGDLFPPIEATLKDAAGDPINLTGAAVKFLLRKTRAAVLKVNATMAIVSAAGGQVKYDWVAGDTNEAGVYDFEFEITFTGGSKLTVPNNAYEQLRIYEDLG